MKKEQIHQLFKQFEMHIIIKNTLNTGMQESRIICRSFSNLVRDAYQIERCNILSFGTQCVPN